MSPDGDQTWSNQATWASFGDAVTPIIKLAINGSRVVAKMGRNVIMRDLPGDTAWRFADSVGFFGGDNGGNDRGYRGNYPGANGEWHHAIAIHPTDSNTIATESIFLFLTTDGGATWDTIPSGHEDIQSLAFSPSGGRSGDGDGGGLITRTLSQVSSQAKRRRVRRAPVGPQAPVHDLEGMLRRLHLPTVRRLFGELATRAEAEGMSYHTYLETLIAEEIAHRAETRITRAVRKARFPFLRTIDDFNFTFQTALKLQMLCSYLGSELVSEGRNAIFSGPSGTGKTHLAIAIAYRAIQHGYEARFAGADRLIGELSRAAAKGRLDMTLEPYLHPHVLIIDELGYLSHAADAANVLYRVINERYLQQRPVLLTTNKPLAAWGDVVHDGDLAEAILDRLLERGVHFTLRGRSYRTRHLNEEDHSTRRAKTA